MRASRVQTSLVLLVGLTAIAAMLLTVRLTSWPYPWFDEGLNTATAATISEHGIYGLPDSDGIRVMDPAIQTGPPVLLPVALSFKLFGAGLLQARLVMAVFGMMALGAFVLLGRRLAGTGVAVTAAGFLLIGTGDLYTSFVPLSRQVLGEVPALGLFCLGCWLIARHVQEPARSVFGTSVAAGLLFGLAMITKSQMTLILPAALGALWILNLVYYRAVHRWLPFIVAAVAGVSVLGWYLFQIMYVGLDEFNRNREVLSEGFSIHIARFSLSGHGAAFETLVSTGFVFWGAPGVLYGCWLARTRDRQGFMNLLPLLLIVFWLVWFLFLSIGWTRYAALPFMLTPLFTARLVHDLLLRRVDVRAFGFGLRMRVAVVGLVGVGLLIPILKSEVLPVFDSRPSGHGQMVRYLEEDVDPSAVVETWAWELDGLVPQPLHHPPTPVTNAYTRHLWEGRPIPAGVYDVDAVEPEYILGNSFSAWTGVYDDVLDQRGELVTTFGRYSLYRIQSEPGP